MDENAVIAKALASGRDAAAEYAAKGNAQNWVIPMGIGRAISVLQDAELSAAANQAHLAALEEELKVRYAFLPEKGNLIP